MNVTTEWHSLQNQLHQNKIEFNHFENQFFRRLLILLSDINAKPIEQLLAYKDALKAAPINIEKIELPLIYALQNNKALFDECGLQSNYHNGIHLVTEEIFSDNIDLSDIYQLKERRIINRLKIDPALKKKLNDDNYQYYNGSAQQLAVRLALTSEDNSTLLINLPTGSGKTLVAHALSLYTRNNKLTLVIVPTTALAIEQGKRAAELFKKVKSGHGGIYFWHGNQSQSQHQDIKDSIRKQQQSILFCSPEAACTSLLPALFNASENNGLANIVIDEAHLVDQWGAGFRPYFQIFSSIVRALRESSPNGLKCILMSATFTEKTVKVLKRLFEVENKQFLEIHGSFLRPEIQYHIKRCSYEAHNDKVINAIFHLPKPMIVYAVEVNDATVVFNQLKKRGISRIRLFTGKTLSGEREALLEQWNANQLDIMIATSAFGLGMDKADIRSVIHMAVPENIDRFYQEVGRAGRDGKACQSLLLYHDEQFKIANSLNDPNLMTVELGFDRWKSMWQQGINFNGGKKIISIKTFRQGLKRKSASNEDWNRRILLLMQRTGIIQLNLEKPQPPEINPQITESEYQSQLNSYYEDYYTQIIVTPLNDRHLDKKVWESIIEEHRTYEKKCQQQSFKQLKFWIETHKSNALCALLTQHYTIRNIQPEYACGGCPSCRINNKPPHSQTLGHSAHVLGVNFAVDWKFPLTNNSLHKYVYYPQSTLKPKKLLREWVKWLAKLIELEIIQCVCAESAVLDMFNDLLPRGLQKFWIGIPLEELNSDFSFGSQLILVMPSDKKLLDLGWEDSTKLLVAPENILDEQHYNCLWWEKKSTAVSLNTFLLSL